MPLLPPANDANDVDKKCQRNFDCSAYEKNRQNTKNHHCAILFAFERRLTLEKCCKNS